MMTLESKMLETKKEREREREGCCSPRLHWAGLWISPQVKLVCWEPGAIIDKSEELLLNHTLGSFVKSEAVEVAVPFLIGRIVVAEKGAGASISNLLRD
jgi:hypothetical protein